MDGARFSSPSQPFNWLYWARSEVFHQHSWINLAGLVVPRVWAWLLVLPDDAGVDREVGCGKNDQAAQVLYHFVISLLAFFFGCLFRFANDAHFGVTTGPGS